jgi:hypothetical protein
MTTYEKDGFKVEVETYPVDETFAMSAGNRGHIWGANVIYDDVIADYEADDEPEGFGEWADMHVQCTLRLSDPFGGSPAFNDTRKVIGVLPKLSGEEHTITDMFDQRSYTVDKLGAQLAAATMYYDYIREKNRRDGNEEKAERLNEKFEVLHTAACAYSPEVAKCLN